MVMNKIYGVEFVTSKQLDWYYSGIEPFSFFILFFSLISSFSQLRYM